MTTHECITILREAFGEAWSPKYVRTRGEYVLLHRPGSPNPALIWGGRGEEYGSDPGGWADTIVRAMLLSAAIEECERRPLQVMCRPHDVQLWQQLPPYVLCGDGPDPLSRLCDAIRKMPKEERK